MRCAHHIVHVQQRLLQIGHRFGLEHIEGRHTGPPRLQGGHQRTRLDQFGATGVGEQCIRLHACEILCRHHATRLRIKAHVQTQHIGLCEQRFAAGCGFITVCTRQGEATLTRPDLHTHAEGTAKTGNLPANTSVAPDTQRTPVQTETKRRLPATALQAGHLLRNLPHRADDQTPGEFRRRRRGTRLAGA